MRKLMLFAAAAVMSVATFAQSANVGIDQFSSLNPQPGTVSLETHESGISAINFNFLQKADVARDKDLFITLKRNGEVISNVPASNYSFIKYDGILADVWQVSFFGSRNYECSAGGNYQVIIPEGFFLIGDDQTPNSEIVINYYIAPPTVSIYPPESRDITLLQDFTVTFGNAKSIEVNNDAEHSLEIIDVFGGTPDEPSTGDDDDDVATGEVTSFDYELTVNENSALIHLLEPITNGSTYDMTIPAGFFYLYDEAGNMTENTEIMFQYAIPKVGNGQPELENVGSLVLDFPGVIELNLGVNPLIVNDKGQNTLCPVNEDGTLGEPIASYRAAGKASHFYKDDPSNATKVFLVNELGEDVYICPAPGLYQLTTSNGLYSVYLNNKMETVSSFKYTFEVIDGDLFVMEFTPENGSSLESLKEIKVKFPEAKDIEVVDAISWLRSKTTSYQFYPSTTVEDNTITFSTSVPVTMPGNYRFTSNLKSVYVDDEYVGIVADYNVSDPSGVGELNNVVVLPESFDIFNAQGMIIKRNADINDLNALPAGIYIAGGKKIVNR